MLAELQRDLKKAKKRKKKSEIEEIKMKIKSAEKEYDKAAAELLALYDVVLPMENRLKDIGLALKKI